MIDSTYNASAEYRQEMALLSFFADETISSASIKKFAYPKQFTYLNFFGTPEIQSLHDERFFTEALEELESIERGEFATYEEVFGEPQPGL
jgi:hypothetical protein